MVTLLDTLCNRFQQLFTNFREALSSAPIPAAPLAGALGAALTLALHVLVAVLAVLIVLALRRLAARPDGKCTGALACPTAQNFPLNHWENIIGRAASCIVLSLPTVSRQHAAVQRDENNLWTITPWAAGAAWPSTAKKVNYQRAITVGDKVTVGGIDLYFFPASAEELRQQTQRRQRPCRRFRPTTTLAYLTAFQGLFAPGAGIRQRRGIHLFAHGVLRCIVRGHGGAVRPVPSVPAHRIRAGKPGVLSHIAVPVHHSLFFDFHTAQANCFRVAGPVLFVLLGLFLRDLAIAKKLRWPVAIAACALLAFNVLFGQQLFGARNWVSIGPLSFQPSEFSESGLYSGRCRNHGSPVRPPESDFHHSLFLFCVGCLALMSDFGTALIFFIAFLAIAFLRSGDLPALL